MKLLLVLVALNGFFFAESTEFLAKETDKLVRIPDKYKPKEYYMGNFHKVDFFEANQFCTTHGMYLVTINSEEENNDLLNFINENGKSTERYWTSGTDLGKEGSWIWMSISEIYTFNNFKNGEPNDGKSKWKTEDCMEIRKVKDEWVWNDTICTEKRYFICEGTFRSLG